mmetsp:Transcript_24783/g.62316  ORF Transcript_24783/g.62316 Transcript_24783/m.62316 type:complete len:271 (+) Transcript_24783:148-960(+)
MLQPFLHCGRVGGVCGPLTHLRVTFASKQPHLGLQLFDLAHLLAQNRVLLRRHIREVVLAALVEADHFHFASKSQSLLLDFVSDLLGAVAAVPRCGCARSRSSLRSCHQLLRSSPSCCSASALRQLHPRTWLSCTADVCLLRSRRRAQQMEWHVFFQPRPPRGHPPARHVSRQLVRAKLWNLGTQKDRGVLLLFQLIVILLLRRQRPGCGVKGTFHRRGHGHRRDRRRRATASAAQPAPGRHRPSSLLVRLQQLLLLRRVQVDILLVRVS